MFLPNGPAHIYQLHILLLHINPPVWRRLHVRSDTSIAMLHDLLQIAFDLERLSPSPLFDSRQGVRHEPVGRLHGVQTSENDSDEILTDHRLRVMPRPTGQNSDVPQHLHVPPLTELKGSDLSAIGAHTISIRAH